MTRFESTSLVISGIALVISLAAPAVTFYWFDTNSRDYDERGRFALVQVSVDEALDPKPKDEQSSVTSYLVTNIGKRPVKSATISVVYPKRLKARPALVFSPPLPWKTKTIEDAVFYTLEQAIAPQGNIEVSVRGPTLDISISNDHGDAVSLLSSGHVKEVSWDHVRRTEVR